MTKHAHSGAVTKQLATAMFFISILFFILGFVTWLNGSLIPFLKIVCDLSDFQALWVTFAFYIAYTLMALPSAAVLKYTGYKNGMTLSLCVMAIGALLFISAATTSYYGLFFTSTVHFSEWYDLDADRDQSIYRLYRLARDGSNAYQYYGLV